jgi:hypothetical protein
MVYETKEPVRTIVERKGKPRFDNVPLGKNATVEFVEGPVEFPVELSAAFHR